MQSQMWVRMIYVFDRLLLRYLAEREDISLVYPYRVYNNLLIAP